MKTSGRLGAILSDLIESILSQRRLGQDCPSRDKWGQPHPNFGWQDRRCWPTTRRFTRPAASTAAPNKNLESSVAWVVENGGAFGHCRATCCGYVIFLK